MPAPRRLRDDGRTRFQYLDDVLVRCPRCKALAHVRRDREETGMFGAGRFTCSECPHRMEWRQNSISIGALGRGVALDPYFLLPLALQVSTRLGVLFAYNGAHLAWIEDYVRADLRERRPAGDGWWNQSIGSRLPAWVKAGRNRTEVLRALSRIRSQLAEPQ